MLPSLLWLSLEDGENKTKPPPHSMSSIPVRKEHLKRRPLEGIILRTDLCVMLPLVTAQYPSQAEIRKAD